MKRLAGLVVGVAVIASLRFYNKASAHDDVRARLIELCAGDAQCQGAVQAHYDGCFDSAYGGGSRAASRLDASALVSCVNKRSGEEYFTVDEKKK
jgi:hypothetical protein